MGWVRKLFGELQGSYGTRFLDMWRSGQTNLDGDDVGLLNAMALWAEKLAGFRDRPDAIRRALDNLPPHPPTLPEFVGLCRTNCPPPEFKALPSPGPDEETRASRKAEIDEQARAVASATPNMGWAHKHRTDWLAGRNLRPIEIEMGSSALGEVWFVGEGRKRCAVKREDVAA